jgi:hypothetical protein
LVTDRHRIGWVITFVVAAAIAATFALDHYGWGTRAPARAASAAAAPSTTDVVGAAPVTGMTTIPKFVIPA